MISIDVLNVGDTIHILDEVDGSFTLFLGKDRTLERYDSILHRDIQRQAHTSEHRCYVLLNVGIRAFNGAHYAPLNHIFRTCQPSSPEGFDAAGPLRFMCGSGRIRKAPAPQ
jgi:hypothetical protein